MTDTLTIPPLLTLKVQVIPGANQNAFVELSDSILRVQIKAQPQDNEANQALIKFISKEFKTPQKNVTITAGLKSRLKIIQITGARKIPDILS